MSAARNGAARERRVSKHMQDRGWLQIMRAAASKGAADLAMLHPYYGLAWVQVGTAKSKAIRCDDPDCDHGGQSGAWCGRDRLVAIAEQTHAVPLLATSGPGIPTRYFVVTRDTASTWQEYQP